MKINYLNNISESLKDNIEKYCEIDNCNIFCTRDSSDISEGLDCIINLEKINNIRRINRFHEDINKKIKKNSIYIICAETLAQRHKRNRKKIFFGFKSIYLFIDFIYKRVIPKLFGLKQLYFFFTKGHNRVLSKAEILGRLISCGYKINEILEYENLLYIISEKYGKPDYNLRPSYGPFFKMKRLGYKGKEIGIYKIRTMHPYSEYLQAYLYSNIGLNEDGDKINNDFRITTWGKFFRKYWIDELPQLINLLKGELNIVGVRAISLAKFNLYPQEMQRLRTLI